MKTWALVTLYFPTQDQIHNIELLCAQCDKVILCDNTPGKDNHALFESLPADKITYRAGKKNLGLSRAFNQELKDQSHGFSDEDFIIFFDQDSTINENHIKSLENIFLELEEKNEKPGAVVPVTEKGARLVNSQTLNPQPLPVKNCYSVLHCITSSMLTRYSILRKIGFWNEEFFLDQADHEFSFRMLDYGYKIAQSEDIYLNHKIGNGLMHRHILHHIETFAVNAPIRDYYIIRDGLKLLRLKYTPKGFRKYLRKMIFHEPVDHLVYLPKRIRRLYYILRGHVDFMANKSTEI